MSALYDGVISHGPQMVSQARGVSAVLERQGVSVDNAAKAFSLIIDEARYARVFSPAPPLQDNGCHVSLIRGDDSVTLTIRFRAKVDKSLVDCINERHFPISNKFELDIDPRIVRDQYGDYLQQCMERLEAWGIHETTIGNIRSFLNEIFVNVSLHHKDNEKDLLPRLTLEKIKGGVSIKFASPCGGSDYEHMDKTIITLKGMTQEQIYETLRASMFRGGVSPVRREGTPGSGNGFMMMARATNGEIHLGFQLTGHFKQHQPG